MNSKTRKILIATTNPGKTREYKELLADLDLEIVALNDFKDFKIVEETGSDFEQNAVLKAKGYFSQFHIPCLADDGGLMIDALDNAPGVKSHRWPGYEASDKELAQYALKKLTGIPKEQRTACLAAWVVFYDGQNLLLESGEINGYITEKFPHRMEKGFPWRSILFISRFNKLYQDLNEEEHAVINHRRKILEKLKPRIKQVLMI